MVITLRRVWVGVRISRAAVANRRAGCQPALHRACDGSFVSSTLYGVSAPRAPSPNFLSSATMAPRSASESPAVAASIAAA